MRISRIAIQNYANFESVDFATDDNLVIVGENKAGKSNLLRALRLVLDPMLPDRDRQLGLEHFWDGLNDTKLGATVKVLLEFTDFEDNDNLLAVLGGSLVHTENPVVARLTYLYRPKAALEGAAPRTLADYEFLVFGGTNEDNVLTAARRRELPMDYLFALRDAEGDLLNWRRSPLRPIIEELTAGLDEESRKELEQLVSSAQNTLAQRSEVSAAAGKVYDRLVKMVGDEHAVSLTLGATPTNVDVLLRGLRLLIDGGARGIGDASLGTANLLFLTLKGLELERAVEAGERSHTFLAIEEPEAHLHPHVQRLVYRHYLGEKDDAPENVTTILTTHSPHIVSVAPLRSVILLRENAKCGATSITSAAEVELLPDEEDDLQRYIDVTRGELFFARGIIFVEGDAERFLIPEFATALDVNLDTLGVTVCSVASANFLPYLKLVGPNALNIPFVILTDLDPPDDGGAPLAFTRVREILALWMQQEEVNQYAEFDDIWEDAEANGVFVNDKTLEVELFQAGMGAAMAAILKKHANSWGLQRRGEMTAWINDPTTLNEGKLLSWIGEVGKGRFAQALAGSATEAICPDYIKKALKYVKNGFSPVEF
ncbi:ATP-dependent endonuclease [Stenotrophomonas sp. HMWF022]|uniref:ATP-dependent nuclease n=1 Tax=Stenotrophomonas sp. HMWF023 TaxID=2056859 RepID=UPI000D39B8F3|nr:AAA family ATPase [Stenotrophomonas sp. HMWF023]PTS79822.1 ATP-dependent endonuclease [Stenotrophomonas sp. HMWF023]PTT43112.1 ATP-dependent endonuclease [Stenotrophomonas sp. HMWF022]